MGCYHGSSRSGEDGTVRKVRARSSQGQGRLYRKTGSYEPPRTQGRLFRNLHSSFDSRSFLLHFVRKARQDFRKEKETACQAEGTREVRALFRQSRSDVPAKARVRLFPAKQACIRNAGSNAGNYSGACRNKNRRRNSLKKQGAFNSLFPLFLYYLHGPVVE